MLKRNWILGLLSFDWSHCEDIPRDPFKDITPPKDGYIIIKSDDLVLSYDSRTRNPRFVIERLKANQRSLARPKRPQFTQEESIAEEFRPGIDDYKLSGFDRGHLAPAADFKHSKEIFKATFSMANISPQVRPLDLLSQVTIASSNKSWYLEGFRAVDQRLTKNEVLVISGPAFNPIGRQRDSLRVIMETIGSSPHLIHVPTHFFKVVVARKLSKHQTAPETISCAAFLVPNSPIHDILPPNYPLSPQSFLVKISDLEAAVGMKFFEAFVASDFSRLIDQSMIECDPKSQEISKIQLSASHSRGAQRKSKLTPRSHFLFHESYIPSFLETDQKERNSKILLNDVLIRDQTHFISRHLCASCESADCSRLFHRMGGPKTSEEE